MVDAFNKPLVVGVMLHEAYWDCSRIDVPNEPRKIKLWRVTLGVKN